MAQRDEMTTRCVRTKAHGEMVGRGVLLGRGKPQCQVSTHYNVVDHATHRKQIGRGLIAYRHG
jgi:hypothetical protein